MVPANSPEGAVYRFDTKGSTYASSLSVYTSASVTGSSSGFDDLTSLGEAGKNLPDGNSLVVLNSLVSGQYVYIAIDAIDSEVGVGPVTLNLSRVGAPANDNFSKAAVLQLTSAAKQVTANGTTLGATAETGEPNHANSPSTDGATDSSVWYRFTVPTVIGSTAGIPRDYIISVNAPSASPIVAAYKSTAKTNPTFASLASLEGVPNFGSDISALQVSATGGTVLYIAVDSQSGIPWDFALTLRPYNPPANDNFEKAKSLTGSVGQEFGSTVDAGAEEGENPSSQGNGRTIWYKWTAPVPGDYNFSVTASEINASVAIYGSSAEGEPTGVGNLEQLDAPSQPGFFTAVAGTTYFIQVFVAEADSESGATLLNWSYQGVTVTFDSPNYTVLESKESVSLVVIRSSESANLLDSGASFNYTISTPEVPASSGTAASVSNDLGLTEENLTGTVTFEAGSDTALIEIPIVNNTVSNERNKLFTVELSAGNNETVYIAPPSAATVTILDDDKVGGIVSFDERSLYIRRNENVRTVSFRVNREATISGSLPAISVPYTITEDPEAPSSFAANLRKSGTIQIAAARTSGTLSLAILNDKAFDKFFPAKSFIVTLGSAPANTPDNRQFSVNAGANVAEGDIIDDDGPGGLVELASKSYTAANGGSVTLTFKRTKTKFATQVPVQLVDLNLVDDAPENAAQPEIDFPTPLSDGAPDSTVSFAKGKATATVTLELPFNPESGEDPVVFGVRIGEEPVDPEALLFPTPGADDYAQVSIVNMGSFNFNLEEEFSDGTSFTFTRGQTYTLTVNRDGGSYGAATAIVSAPIVRGSGLAVAADFTIVGARNQSITLRFAEGETSKTVTLRANTSRSSNKADRAFQLKLKATGFGGADLTGETSTVDATIAFPEPL